MNKTLFFEATERVISGRDVTELIFPFRLVDTELIGRPEEISKSSHHRIAVVVSGTLSACWDFSDDHLHRVMFEYGKRHVIQKIHDGTLRDTEELDLHTGNAERPCPFDPTRIENPINAVVEVKATDDKIMEDSTLLQLASSIIDARDNINAIFNFRNNCKLIILTEERDLLQFFRNAESSEEFSYRLCALANASTRMNMQCLRSLTQTENTEVRSIKLLEDYLKGNGVLKPQIIDTLRNINKIRQGYPVHGDRVDGVLEAHSYFAIEYPITDYNSAWRKLLNHYLTALQQLLEALKKMKDK